MRHAPGYTSKVQQALAEGKAEGIEKGKAEVYREVQEWDRRRRASRGEEFTEPPPTQP